MKLVNNCYVFLSFIMQFAKFRSVEKMKKLFSRKLAILLIVSLLLVPCIISIVHASSGLGLETNHEWEVPHFLAQ